MSEREEGPDRRRRHRRSGGRDGAAAGRDRLCRLRGLYGRADDAGSFLTFAINGLDALRTIDAHHLVLAEGFPTPRMAIQSGTGKRLGEVPNGGTLPDGTVSQTLKRADLYRALRDEAVRRGARVEYGKRLVDAETTPGGVVARFEDGTEAEGDLLIGADGIHSRTRRIIDPSAPEPRYVPVLNIGGYARGVAVQAEPGTFRMVFGKRAFFGYAVSRRARSGGSPTLPAPTSPRARSSPPPPPSSGGGY